MLEHALHIHVFQLKIVLKIVIGTLWNNVLTHLMLESALHVHIFQRKIVLKIVIDTLWNNVLTPMKKSRCNL